MHNKCLSCDRVRNELLGVVYFVNVYDLDKRIYQAKRIASPQEETCSNACMIMMEQVFLF